MTLTALVLFASLYIAVIMSQLKISTQVLGLTEQNEIYSEFKPVRLHHGVPVVNPAPSQTVFWRFGLSQPGQK